MTAKPSLLIALLFLFANASAQSLRSYEQAGDEAFRQKDYGAAVQHYRIVLQRHGDDLQVQWKYAESARLYYSYAEAEKAYRKISSSGKQKKAFELVDFRLGEIKKSQGDYTAAVYYFEKFLTEKPSTDANFIEKAKLEIETSRMAKTLAESLPPVEINHLGKEINSAYSDFAPMLVGDTLFFSSYRFDKKGGHDRSKSKLAKVMISSRGGRAREPGRGFPTTDTAHVAHTAFSPDGHYVFFTVCKNLNAKDIRCELWLTIVDRRNRWLPPVRLPEPVNLKGYTTTQPSVGYDSIAQGPVLWFASDRPGGRGKLDVWSIPLDTIFFCPCALPLPGKKITHLPDFESPRNAAAVNTAENDATPFFHAPSQKLYFSSEGWPGLGGYDIFSAQKQGDSLSKPANMGLGINSSYNDLYLFLKADGREGYLSSNRPGSFYLDEANKACCNDLFSFRLPPPETPKPAPLPTADTLPLITAKTPLSSPSRPQALPLQAPPQLQDFVGLPLFFDNDEPDKRTRHTTTKKNYDETAQAYLEKQREYREHFARGLSVPQAEVAEEQVDDFFENELQRGADRLSQLCDLILARLQKGERLEIVIKGFTSPRAQSDYNINLGKRRISSVRNQFEIFADGALQPFLRSGQLTITEASFGETTARAGISDQLNDERNSVYHPDAARERRVEIVEIREQ